MPATSPPAPAPIYPLSPSSGSGGRVAVSPVSDATDVDRAFAAARAAFRSWKRTTPSERQLLLLRLADALEMASVPQLADITAAMRALAAEQP